MIDNSNTGDNRSLEGQVSPQLQQFDSIAYGVYFSALFSTNRRGLRMYDPLPHLAENQAALLERSLGIVSPDGTNANIDWASLNSFLTILNGGEIVASYGIQENASAIAQRIEADWRTSTLQLYDEQIQASAFFKTLAGNEPNVREEAIFAEIEKVIGGTITADERHNIIWEARATIRTAFAHKSGADKYAQLADDYVDALITLSTQENSNKISDKEKSSLTLAIHEAIGNEPWEFTFKAFNPNEFIEGLVNDPNSMLKFLNSCTGKEASYLALMVAQLQYAISRYNGRNLSARGLKAMVNAGTLGEHLLLTIFDNRNSLGALNSLWKVLGSLTGMDRRYIPYPAFVAKANQDQIRESLIGSMERKLSLS